jgi:hypothetical protein
MKAWIGIQYLYTISSLRANSTTLLHRKLPSVFTYTEAVAHGLTDNIPARIDVAIPRGHRVPVLQSPVDIRVFAKDTFELGRTELKIGEGFAVGSYSPDAKLRCGSDV